MIDRDAVRNAVTGGNPKLAMAKNALESEWAAATLAIVAHRERQLVEHVDELHDELGLDGIDDIPDPDDRVEQIRAFALAMIDDSAAEWWVEHVLADRIDNASEAAQYADLDPEEWADQREQWADTYREQGVDGTTDELAAAHTRARYGLDLDEFESVVVEWSDDRQREAVESVMLGGLDTADQGVVDATEHLRDQEA